VEHTEDEAQVTRRESGGGRFLSVLTIIGEIVGLLMQVLLMWVAGRIIWGSEHVIYEVLLRLLWCTVAFVYLGFTVVGLNILVRIDHPDPRAVRALVGHPLTRILSTILTLGASLLGLTVALELIVELGSDEHTPLSQASAVASMLLSWAMFNWGFARVYFSRYHRAKTPPLLFPGTPEPRLVDFVYLSFTNATTFGVSDVQVVSTRMRWTIVWHTSLAFFFNALIIALTLNVVTNGSMFAGLFD